MSESIYYYMLRINALGCFCMGGFGRFLIETEGDMDLYEWIWLKIRVLRC
jgi:hypothetical protein